MKRPRSDNNQGSFLFPNEEITTKGQGENFFPFYGKRGILDEFHEGEKKGKYLPDHLNIRSNVLRMDILSYKAFQPRN